MSCRPCARIILITFNFLFFIAGALLLAFGIVGVTDPIALTRFLSGIPGMEKATVIIDVPATIVGSAVFMIILGGIMLVFGFFGCIGAWCMAKWMLFIYWFVLVIILLAEVALIIVAAVSPTKVEGHVKEVLLNSLKDKFQPVSIVNNTAITLPSSLVAAAWVSLQFEVGCCGANNYTDYQDQDFKWNNTFLVDGQMISASVPPSCCVLKKPNQIPHSTSEFVNLSGCLNLNSPQDSHEQGCYKSVTVLMKKYSYAPIIIAAVVIFIEIVAIAAAVYLWKSNDKKLVV